MKTNATITPYIAESSRFSNEIDAQDTALLFNLATTGNLEARVELDGYAESAKYRIRLSYVRLLDRDGVNERKCSETIGWLIAN